jgi:hypothetical protein
MNPAASWISYLKEGQWRMVNGWYGGRFEEIGVRNLVDGRQGLVREESYTGS